MGLWLPASPLVLLLAVVAYALAEGSSVTGFLRLLGVGLMASSAAWLLGALVGFLFGLPRTVGGLATTVGSPTPEVAGAPGAADVTDASAQQTTMRVERAITPALMRTNTNLEEISDWLTKILVGLGLVQLGAFVSRLDRSGAALAAGLGGGPAAKPFALGLLIYGLIDGFLFGYLWTRTVASLRLKSAEEALQRTLIRDEMIASVRNTLLASPPPPAPPTTLPPAPPSEPGQNAGPTDEGRG